MPTKKKLNDKQMAFVRNYLVTKNASDAAVKAGYSPKTAGAQAHKLLKIAEIKRLVGEGQKRLAERLEVKAEDVIAELKKIAFAPVDMGELTVKDKVTALERLGKHLGLFDEKHRHEHEGAVTINVVSAIPGAPGSRIGEAPPDDD